MTTAIEKKEPAPGQAIRTLHGEIQERKPNDFDIASLLPTAGTLKCTKEQEAILFAPVNEADVDIRPDGLIYVPWTEHARRLREAFGTEWAIIPHGLPQAKDNIVYWGFYLIIKGKLVGFAIGEQEYIPENRTMSWGDACEGAKSNALTRLGKELGMCHQLWDKSFIDKWVKAHAESYTKEGKVDKFGKPKKFWRKKAQGVEQKTEAKTEALDKKLEEAKLPAQPDKELREKLARVKAFSQLAPEEAERQQVEECKSYIVEGLAFHEIKPAEFFSSVETKMDKPQTAWGLADWERAKVAFNCLVNGKYRLTPGTGGCKLEVVTEEKKQAPKVRKSISEKISALLKELNLMSDAQRLLQDTVGVDSLEKLDTQHASAFFNVLSDAKEGRCNLRRLDNGKWEVEYPPQEGLGNRIEDQENPELAPF